MSMPGAVRSAPAAAWTHDVYADTLRRAADGGGVPLRVESVDGATLDQLHPAQWTGTARPGDAGLLRRCRGPVLDVGCGPGRLAAALGRAALGVDVCPEAVRQTRSRGAYALRRDVFDPLPREGAWRRVLLADGNIGIGGDPVRLLRRCAELLAPGGGVLVEVTAPGTATWAADVVLAAEGRRTPPFPWASVAAADVAGLARHACLRILDTWTEAGRWFAHLSTD
jgi:SAM-dependent methyltransferase